jgi:hypothetical protein
MDRSLLADFSLPVTPMLQACMRTDPLCSTFPNSTQYGRMVNNRKRTYSMNQCPAGCDLRRNLKMLRVD